MRKTLLFAALWGLATTLQAQDFKWQAFYAQTYENVAQVGDVWTAPSNQGGLSIVEQDGNHYVQYNHGNNNSRGLYNLDALTQEMYEGIEEYRLEFDLALTSGSNQFSTFNVGGPDIQTMGSDWVTPCGNITKYPNNGLGAGSLFSLIQDAVNSDYWRVYCGGPVGTSDAIPEDDEYRISLPSGTFHHFAITVTPHEYTDAEPWSASVVAEVTDMEGNPVPFNVNGEEQTTLLLPYIDLGSGYWFKQFYVLSGRYNSVMKIDNLQVMKKVEADAVSVPTLSMIGVQLDGRIIALENIGEDEGLTSYYAVVDEDTYYAAESSEGLTAVAYTEPFVVSEAMNYVLAWNVNAAGKPSELTKFTIEAGWSAQLNAPSISAVDYNGYKKTYVATCTQSTVQPLAPLSYTIYMSADSVEWVATDTLVVKSGKVYAKVEAEGYLPAGCEPVEAPEGAYGSTRWTCVGAVLTPDNCPEGFASFDTSKGRISIDPKYWNEDESDFVASEAWSVLKGLHIRTGSDDFASVPTNGGGTLFAYVPKDGSGVVSGIAIYGKSHVPCYIEGLQEGDIVRVVFDTYSNIYTVTDPENFSFEMPIHGNGMLVAVDIKGAGTVETRKVTAGEWGIVTSDRTVGSVEQAGAIFYDHVYTIYNDETSAADTLLLLPVANLEAGKAYIYQATADEMELVTLEAEEPVYEQLLTQKWKENYTFVATLDEEEEDDFFYTMFPGGFLMKNNTSVVIPQYSGYFVNLEDAAYSDELDYKNQDEYLAIEQEVEEAFEAWDELPEYTYVFDEEGNIMLNENGEEMLDKKPDFDEAAVYQEKLQAHLAKYVVIPVVHEYNEQIATSVQTVKAEREALVNVVTPAGIVVRRGVKPADALNGLKPGLYIVGHKKVVK